MKKKKKKQGKSCTPIALKTHHFHFIIFKRPPQNICFRSSSKDFRTST